MDRWGHNLPTDRYLRYAFSIINTTKGSLNTCIIFCTGRELFTSPRNLNKKKLQN